MTFGQRAIIVVFDPISFHGGSKAATLTALKQSSGNLEVHVLTATPGSWQDADSIVKVRRLPLDKQLATQTSGGGYWGKQCYFMFMLALFCLWTKLTHRKQSMKLLLASGPGVDMAGYWLAKICRLTLVQLIHGPVGKSRLSSWAVQQGHPTFYLPSSKVSLQALLPPDTDLPINFRPFVNGLGKDEWPLQQYNEFGAPLQIFWAASLLKWKGLHVMEQALKQRDLDTQYRTKICYIKPIKSAAEQSLLPDGLANCTCIENPSNLGHIRAQSHIFISTSHNEPFGLSILEALAAGLVVVIPKDGAFWDQQLEHGVDCFKYQPGCADSLNLLLGQLLVNRSLLPRVAKNGQKHSASYQATLCYAEINEFLIATPYAAQPADTQCNNATYRG